MNEALSRAWAQLLDRQGGPLHFRFVMQPLIAVLLAIRAGTKDARTYRSPYVWGLLSNPAERRLLVRGTVKDAGKLFLMAVVLDCLYQLLEVHAIYPLQALIVAFVLVIVPYVVVRGPVTRIMSCIIARRE